MARHTDLIFFVEEVGGNIRSGMVESFRVAAARFALAAPANDTLAGCTEALEKDVAVLVWKIEFAGLFRRVRAEIHVSPVIKVEKLQRVDERCLARVVWPDDLQRARKLHFGVFVTPGADGHELR